MRTAYLTSIPLAYQNVSVLVRNCTAKANCIHEGSVHVEGYILLIGSHCYMVPIAWCKGQDAHRAGRIAGEVV